MDASGIRHLNATGGLIGGFYTHIVGAAARIYGTDGSIVDAERRVKVGSFPAISSAILPDPATGRAFMLVGSGIAVYDLNNFQLLGTVPVADINLDHPALISPRLVRWGSDGIAFLDADDLFLVRSPSSHHRMSLSEQQMPWNSSSRRTFDRSHERALRAPGQSPQGRE